MEKKYELLKDDRRFYLGKYACRIRALRDVNSKVKAGDLGGYIVSEEQLSHEGTVWVYPKEVLVDRIRHDSILTPDTFFDYYGTQIEPLFEKASFISIWEHVKKYYAKVNYDLADGEVLIDAGVGDNFRKYKTPTIIHIAYCHQRIYPNDLGTLIQEAVFSYAMNKEKEEAERREHELKGIKVSW